MLQGDTVSTTEDNILLSSIHLDQAADLLLPPEDPLKEELPLEGCFKPSWGYFGHPYVSWYMH